MKHLTLLLLFVSLGFFSIAQIPDKNQLAESPKPLKNEISIAPLSPFFRNVQVLYDRQIDPIIKIGVHGRYYFSAPPSDYDSIKSNGGDLTLYAKCLSRKKPGGLYALFGASAGYYNTAAGYGESVNGWFGPYDAVVIAEPRSFFTFGGKFSLGYEVVISHFCLDFSTGAKFLILPSSVTNNVDGYKLVDSWGTYSWTDVPSPGSIFSLGITAGYRF